MDGNLITAYKQYLSIFRMSYEGEKLFLVLKRVIKW
jgi:hypothetical protein